jgi:autotransporter-associated beta strand protein
MRVGRDGRTDFRLAVPSRVVPFTLSGGASVPARRACNRATGGPTVTRSAKTLALALAVTITAVSFGRADDKAAGDDTPKAAAARKLLKKKITVNFKETPLKDVIEEIKDEHVPGISIRLDTKGGVSQNQAITYRGSGVTLEQALDEMFKKNGLGYIVISGKNNAYDGSILIKQGGERGYPVNK